MNAYFHETEFLFPHRTKLWTVKSQSDHMPKGYPCLNRRYERYKPCAYPAIMSEVSLEFLFKNLKMVSMSLVLKFYEGWLSNVKNVATSCEISLRMDNLAHVVFVAHLDPPFLFNPGFVWHLFNGDDGHCSAGVRHTKQHFISHFFSKLITVLPKKPQ